MDLLSAIPWWLWIIPVTVAGLIAGVATGVLIGRLAGWITTNSVREIEEIEIEVTKGAVRSIEVNGSNAANMSPYIISDASSLVIVDCASLEEPRGKARYANIWLEGSGNTGRLVKSTPVETESILFLKVSLGGLDVRSSIDHPQPFPFHPLPEEAAQIQLAVVVASTDFHVEQSEGSSARSIGSAEQTFYLPVLDGPAFTADGQRVLTFELRTPKEIGHAHARINFYFREALVQSYLLSIRVGSASSDITIKVDYTASSRLDDVRSIPDRPRISVFLNENGSGSHTAVLRSGSTSGVSATAVVSLPPEAIEKDAHKLRQALQRTVRSRFQHSRDELIDDLTSVAPLGSKLHKKLFVQAPEIFGAAQIREDKRPLISIVRPRNVTFTLPWSALYYIPLSGDVTKHRICPIVSSWDGRSSLVSQDSWACPLSDSVDHTENILCPYGFWAYGFNLETPPSASSADARIVLQPECSALFAHTTVDVDTDALNDHLSWVENTLTKSFPSSTFLIKRESSIREIKEAFCIDQPFIYLLCHGKRVQNTGSRVDLCFGRADSDSLSTEEVLGWIQASYLKDKPIWSTPRPLIFINACGSLEVTPKTLVSYIDVLVGGGCAAGVIGTEVSVPQKLAMDFAQEVLAGLFNEKWEMASAIRAARFSYLARGNLFGLIYHVGSWAHLNFSEAARHGSAPK